MSSRVANRAPTALAAVLAAAALAPLPASARILPFPLDAANEEELRTLYEEGRLSEDDLTALLDLLADPVDLNRAERDDLYALPGVSLVLAEAMVAERVTNGPFQSWDDLKRRLPALTPDIVRQVVPFAWVRPPLTRVDPVRGNVRLRGAKNFWEEAPLDEDDTPHSSHRVDQIGYGTGPRFELSASVRAWKWLDAGALFFVQEGIGDVVYDPETRDFHAAWAKPLFEFSKAYVAATRPEGSAILGSYTAGFGLGLAFDDTTRELPHGWYADLSYYETSADSVPGRYKSRDGLFGGAARFQGLRFGREWLDLSVFGSSWTYDVYQYDLGLAGGEAIDPLVTETTSPRVYIDGQRVSYITIPNAYRESLIGGNVTFRSGRRNHVGATAYVSHVDRDVIEGVANDHEYVVRDGFPAVDTFGAFGVDGAFGIGLVDLRGEFARTFTGGNALLLKLLVAPLWGEIEFSARRYEAGFDNPHARGISAPDVYGGMRDRDEQGFRLAAKLDPLPFLSARFTGDLWQQVTTGITNAQVMGRVEVRPVRGVEIAAFADLRNRDLVNNGRTRIYGSDTEDEIDLEAGSYVVDSARADLDPDEDVEYGAGEKHQVGVEVRTTLVPRTTFEAYYKRYYEDTGVLYPTGDGPCEADFQVGQYAAFRARVKPTDSTTIALRLRYRDDDVFGGTGERSFEGALQADQLIAGRVKVSLRGTFGRFLADPDSEWKGACADAGIPHLDGSCLAPASEVAVDAPESEDYGEIAGLVEVRF